MVVLNLVQILGQSDITPCMGTTDSWLWSGSFFGRSVYLVYHGGDDVDKSSPLQTDMALFAPKIADLRNRVTNWLWLGLNMGTHYCKQLSSVRLDDVLRKAVDFSKSTVISLGAKLQVLNPLDAPVQGAMTYSAGVLTKEQMLKDARVVALCGGQSGVERLAELYGGSAYISLPEPEQKGVLGARIVLDAKGLYWLGASKT